MQPTPEAATNENDVAIAAIEAERDIAIAETHTEARVAEAEAHAEIVTASIESENEWQVRISHLENELATTRAELLALQQPPISSPPETEAVTVITEETAEAIADQIATESDLIPTSTLGETSETLTEAIEKSVVDGPDLPPLVSVGRKPIVKLV